MSQLPSFREQLISQIPALQLLMAMGREYLMPEEVLALRGVRCSPNHQRRQEGNDHARTH